MKKLQLATIEKAMNDRKVSRSEIKILKLIANYSHAGRALHIRPSQYASKLNINSSTVTTGLKNLEKRGYIKIIKDEFICDRYMIISQYEKITFVKLLHLQNAMISKDKNSKPLFIPLFNKCLEDLHDPKSYVFNKDNENGGDAIICQMIQDYENDNEYFSHLLLNENILFRYRETDEYKSLMLIIEEGDIYTICWKDNNHISKILKNGWDISIEEYISLLNYLQNTSVFYFDTNVDEE